MQNEIYILDLVGTFAFAVYGSYFGLKKHFNIFGIIVAAFLTAVGGGSLREIILGNIPFYFYDPNYVFTIIAGVAFTLLIYNHFHRIKTFVIVIDSIGLVTFAFIGATKANQYELGTFGIIFLATISAVGGGMMRDITLNKSPEILSFDFYASVAVLLGLSFSIFKEHMDNIVIANSLIGLFLIMRLMAVCYKINLCKPCLSIISPKETAENK
ncbi:TRIC cation channel family protein [Candidatus Peregrinibacteria bacterium]|nr:MAG: TRIC cation channel family protein [Candidatus Peregrinibacteria bacterium]